MEGDAGPVGQPGRSRAHSSHGGRGVAMPAIQLLGFGATKAQVGTEARSPPAC